MMDVLAFVGLLLVAAGVLSSLVWELYVAPVVAGFYWGLAK